MMVLPPCPFCGKSDAYVERETYCAFQVRCNNCGARGPVVEEMRFEERPAFGNRQAKLAWKKRLPASAPVSLSEGK